MKFFKILISRLVLGIIEFWNLLSIQTQTLFIYKIKISYNYITRIMRSYIN